MSESTQAQTPRKLEEISKDYTQVCAQIGHLAHQIEVLEVRQFELDAETRIANKIADEAKANEIV